MEVPWSVMVFSGGDAYECYWMMMMKMMKMPKFHADFPLVDFEHCYCYCYSATGDHRCDHHHHHCHHRLSPTVHHCAPSVHQWGMWQDHGGGAGDGGLLTLMMTMNFCCYDC